MGFIWSLIIGGLIGWAAGAITGKGVPFGIIGNIIAGFVGASLGTAILGDIDLNLVVSLYSQHLWVRLF